MDKKGSICAGHPDNHFIEMIKAKKGKLLTVGGEIGSYLDDNPVEMNGQQYSQTIRTVDCSVVQNGRCESCTNYRANLRSMYSQWKKAGKKASTTSSHCNNRYLSTPEKNEKISKLQSTVYGKDKTIARLQEKMKKIIETRGEEVDTELHSDLSTIMQENEQKVSRDLQEGGFQWLLWSELKKAASVKGATGVRWHPLVIRWCLNLKLLPKP